jgi:hypothetical protein
MTFLGEKTIRRFAFWPVETKTGFTWLRHYTVKYRVWKGPHYCHDCINPITPCDGDDEHWQLLEVTK